MIRASLAKYTIIRTRLLIVFLLITISSIFADNEIQYDYVINLNDIEKNRYQVKLNCEDFAQDTLVYHFPWIIPGTYMEANYGKYIHKLKALDTTGKELKVKKEGKNTFLITPANQIKTIEYWVSATWDARGKKIWAMAGTGIVPDRVFAINAGGVFGYFHGLERKPVNMTYSFPEDLYAMTVLDQSLIAPGKASILTSDYHELIDSPILFAYPDTSSFKVHDTDVLVGFAHEYDDTRRAHELVDALEPSMMAIGSYIDSLPADKYAYLIYYSDERAMGKILKKPKFMLLKGLWYVLRHGLPVGGALEHNKSSFYYLSDPGYGLTDGVSEIVKSIAIHEFMHILTPLNLRSQYVHDWDYNDPIMSKHLWLYEGITEYMSQIIQVNGGLKTPKEFLLGTMQSKLRSGERYPFETISFTEMSANVLTKENQKIYTQVYQRGAVMGMLLDLEIIRLTEGRKRLIDVMMELVADYGPTRPMDEDSLIDTFIEKVHPDLKAFFTNHVEGYEALPYAEILNNVGVIYKADTTMEVPKNPLYDNDVTLTKFSLNGKQIIKKAGKKDIVGFKAGDQVPRRFYNDLYFDDFGNSLPEGMAVSLTVERDKEEITLVDTVRYKEDTIKHFMLIRSDMTPEQSRYFNIWLGFEDPGDPVIAKSE